MGVNFRNVDFGEVIPQCNDCGVCLCWSIDELEYYKWMGFWDNWKCRDCNPNYKGAYYEYQQNHEPFEIIKNILK